MQAASPRILQGPPHYEHAFDGGGCFATRYAGLPSQDELFCWDGTVPTSRYHGGPCAAGWVKSVEYVGIDKVRDREGRTKDEAVHLCWLSLFSLFPRITYFNANRKRHADQQI